MTTLLCIPWSGASATVYIKWRRLLPEQVRLVPIELAGRGTRMNEPLYADWREAISDLARWVEGRGLDGPWALFGHSLGGLLGYELVRRLIDQGHPPPVHLFVSGTNPPSWRPPEPTLHLVHDDSAFLERIFQLGGIPLGLMRDPELRSLFTPIIRNDYRLYETYTWTPPARPLACPITILGGALDTLAAPENLAGWSEITTGPCETVLFTDGTHFFIEQQPREVVDVVQRALRSPGT